MTNSESEQLSTFQNDFDEDSAEEPRCSPLYNQILASAGPILITISTSMVSGYSAILLPQLEAEDSMAVTKSEESWIASIATLPMAFGCIFGGWSMEQFGRINAQIIAAIFACTGWAFIYLGDTIALLLVGRFFGGFSLGASIPGVTAYLGEITHPKYRGFFLSGIALSISLGLFFTHLLGTFIHWKTVALISFFPPIVCIAMFFLVHESHVWFMRRNNFKRAQKSFFWFRGKNEESKDELMKLFKDQVKNKDQRRSFLQLVEECRKPQFIKPFVIMNIFFITSQLTGNNAVIYYTVTIMQQTVSNLDRYAATLTVDAIRIVMSGVGCVLAKKFKVRPLTMISGLGCTCSLYFLSAFFHLSQLYPDNGFISVMPMVGLCSYIIFISVGVLSLPWAICSELFPPVTRGVGSGVSICVNFLFLFLIVKTGPDMFENLGTAWTFVTYGSMVLGCTALLYFVLPETKNKTLKEIEAFFVSKSKKVDEGVNV